MLLKQRDSPEKRPGQTFGEGQVLVANLSYRSNQFLDRRIYANRPEPAERPSRPGAQT